MRALLLLAAIAATPAPPPATILVGQSWVGLWARGHVATARPLPGWTVHAVRLSPDHATLLVAARPASRPDAAPTVWRFNARTLAPAGRAVDRAAAGWTPLAAPLGTDERIPDARADALTVTPSAGGLSVAPRAGGPKASYRLPAGTWRLAASADGSTVAAFAKPAAGGAWRGRVWTTAAGRAVTAGDLSIDDGSESENGAARTLACLLPNGAGAIVTYLGAPADRMSEYLPFGHPAAAAVPLRTPYVMTCLTS